LRPVGEIAEVLDRLRRPINSDERAQRGGGYPYYGANGQVGTIDEFIFDEDLVLVAEDGGFFFEPSRPIAYRVSGKCWVNNHAHVLRPLSLVDVDWLCYALAYQDVSDLVKGATRPKLNQKELRQILVPVPPVDEQDRIVARVRDMFARADEIRHLRSESDSERLALRRSARFDVWKELAGRVPGGPLGSTVATSRNGLYKPAGHHGQGVYLVRMFNVSDGAFSNSRLERITVEPDEMLRFGLAEGDILVSRVNSKEQVGKSCMVPALPEAAVYEAMLIRLRLHRDKYDPEFVAGLMNAPQFLANLRGKAKHAIGQSSINQDDLLSMQLPLPALPEQQHIARGLREFDQKVADLVDAAPDPTAVSALRSAILRKAFSGEL
jgi:type I restriction enzyme S subunit